MQKVIIISYFFPPSNFVGGERTASWSKHLADNDIYPIIITRQWNENQKDLTDHVDENDLQIEKHDHCEIVRLPFKRSLRDRLSNYKWLKPLQKALTLKELIFSNLFISALPYSNFYKEVRNRLKEDPTIKAVIVSGRPFQSFSIGHRLKKKFDVLWIPDYRDEWTTQRHLQDESGLKKWINKIERKSELKWTSNANFFLTVSENWANIIGDLISKEGKVVLNGYTELIQNPKREIKKDSFVVTYAGTLYSSQNINIFINSCINLIKEGHNFIVRFIGVNMMPQEILRIKAIIQGYESYFEFLDRMSKEELQGFINQSDLLYLTSFENIKGWYPVKLFEYYASGIPLLLCPSDEGIMESFVNDTNSGFVANSEDDCQTVLLKCIRQKEENGSVTLERNIEFGNRYSRKFQTSVLAEILKYELHK